jgi:hypothetical protein
MPTPDTIIVETVDLIDSITVSPVETVNSVGVNTVSEITNLEVDTITNVTSIDLSDDPGTLDVNVSISDVVIPVTSVNGKTGAVVIDYPDINIDPVNNVKYVHNQPTLSNEWNIPHNLGFFPNIAVVDNDKRLVETAIQYIDINNAKIVMNVAISGVAYLT